MAGSEHKRQKALAKKRKREKEVRKARNSASNVSSRDYVLQLARGAWHVCFETNKKGLNQIACVRRTPAGFGASVFLLDEYCLGIKDADVIRDVSMEGLRSMMDDRGGGIEVSPAYALKKIQALMEWARGIGFEPHPKTSMAMQIFRDVDPNECSLSFSFGRPEDGKPFYVSGPFDGPERIHAIIEKLQKLGEGNFHILVQVASHKQITDLDGTSLYSGDDIEDDEDYDDGEDWDDTPLNVEAIESKPKP